MPTQIGTTFVYGTKYTKSQTFSASPYHYARRTLIKNVIHMRFCAFSLSASIHLITQLKLSILGFPKLSTRKASETIRVLSVPSAYQCMFLDSHLQITHPFCLAILSRWTNGNCVPYHSCICHACTSCSCIGFLARGAKKKKKQ